MNEEKEGRYTVCIEVSCKRNSKYSSYGIWIPISHDEFGLYFHEKLKCGLPIPEHCVGHGEHSDEMERIAIAMYGDIDKLIKYLSKEQVEEVLDYANHGEYAELPLDLSTYVRSHEPEVWASVSLDWWEH